jgi:dUTP pyrophosphatase
MLEIKYCKMNTDAKLPTKSHDNDAGWDFYISRDTFVYKDRVNILHTGIKLAIPTGYFLKLCDRSGMALDGFHVVGGVIDSDYRGEIKIMVVTNEDEHINCGTKVAQGVLLPVPQVKFVEVKSLDVTIRNEKGFGSTDGEL